MRHFTLALPFALGAAAIPGAVKPRSITPSAAPSSTPTTTSATSTTTDSDAAPTINYAKLDKTSSEICDKGNMNRTAWEYYQMDHWTTFYSDSFPLNLYSEETIKKGDRYPDYLMKLANLGNDDCEVDSDCDFTMDRTSCQSGQMPYVYFTLKALKNFYNWQKAARDALTQAHISMGDKATEFMLKFTPQESDDSSVSNGLTIASAVLSAINPLLGPAGPVVSAGTSGIGVATSIMSATQDSAADALEESFKNVANLSATIDTIVGTTDTTLQNLANAVLNHTADNSEKDTGNQWSAWDNSAPKILQNGSFAEAINSDDYNGFKDSFLNSIAAAAISQCWQISEVFIAKASASTQGVAPKDMELVELDDSIRQCDPDGGDTCYFFIVAQKSNNYGSITGKWANAVGVDKTGDYNISAYEFAMAAEWYQSKYGSYLQVPESPSDLVSILQESDDQPAGNMFVNLPVVNYDNCEGYKGNPGGMRTEGIFLSNLANCVMELNGWPYSSNMDWH